MAETNTNGERVLAPWPKERKKDRNLFCKNEIIEGKKRREESLVGSASLETSLNSIGRKEGRRQSAAGESH